MLERAWRHRRRTVLVVDSRNIAHMQAGSNRIAFGASCGIAEFIAEPLSLAAAQSPPYTRAGVSDPARRLPLHRVDYDEEMDSQSMFRRYCVDGNCRYVERTLPVSRTVRRIRNGCAAILNRACGSTGPADKGIFCR